MSPHASSSSLDAPPPPPTPSLKPPPVLQAALAAASNPSTASDETWQDATEHGLDWILSLRSKKANGQSSNSAKGKGREDERSGLVHWFCGEGGADECWDASVFLSRLLVYKRNDEVGEWRDEFDALMLSCPTCVARFQVAKVQLREKYLKVLKPDKAIAVFLAQVEKNELAHVRNAFASVGLSPTSDSHTLVLDLPPSVIQNVLVNPKLFQDDDIVQLLTSALPSLHTLKLPPKVSPGLLAFALHDRLQLREWAQTHLSRCQPATPDDFANHDLGRVINAHLFVLNSRDRRDDAAQPLIQLHYTQSQSAFWKGLSICLSRLSPAVIQPTFVVKPVAGHLGDEGDHLEFVLASLRILLEALGPRFWAAGDDRYEEVVLHGVLDNPDFERAFKELSSASPHQPFLDWLHPLLASVAHSSEAFVNSVAIVANTFLDRFQKSRFEDGPRTLAVQLAMTVLEEIFLDATNAKAEGRERRYPHAGDAEKVLDLHARFIAQLAFSKEYSKTPWIRASETALRFVGNIAARDSGIVKNGVYALAQYVAEMDDKERRDKREKDKTGEGKTGVSSGASTPVPAPVPPPPVRIARAIWEQTYEHVSEDDVRGISILLAAAANSAHLEKLSNRTWRFRDKARAQMAALNEALVGMRERFLPLLENLADERTDLLLDFLGRRGVGEHIATLLLSPVEDVNSTAQGLVKQAFDVTTRRECFRSLIFQFPDAALKGIAYAIKAFTSISERLPEATGMAKRLVRCLSDVIDVLCATNDGLLRDQSFFSRSNEDRKMPKLLLMLWKLMSTALAKLFKQTPTWAGYFENDQMTEWMRDAILFGVDMLNAVQTLDLVISGKGISGKIPGSPSKLSNKGQQMVLALAEPLEELVAWLRLNDADLLALSFDLVCNMLDRFGRIGVAIPESTVAKVRKTTDKALNRDPSQPAQIALRKDQLLELVALLDSGALPGAASAKESGVSSKPSSTSSKSSKTFEVIEIDSDDEDRPAPVRKLVPTAGRGLMSTKVKSEQPKPQPKVGGSLTTNKAGRPVAPPSKSGPNFAIPPMRNVARPRGVPWTTHSSKPATASSSSESSDSDSDGEGSGLAMLAKGRKDVKPSLEKEKEERRTVKMLDDPNSRRFTAREREQERIKEQAARAERLRGKPNFSELHRRILQWDVKHEGPLPPDMDRPPPGVPSKFETPEQYFAAFEPLLFIECWEQLQQAMQEAAQETFPVPTTIAGVQDVNDFLDIFLSIEHTAIRQGMYFGESDLVLLKFEHRQTLAKVERCQRKREFMEMTLRCHLGSDKTDIRFALAPKTQWTIVKITSLSTTHREYAALQTVRYLELSSDILSPKLPYMLDVDPRQLDHTMRAYKVNEPQARAILGSLKTLGFSLIQGPPGTGKTKTILGLIGAFVDSRPRVATAIAVGQRAAPGPPPAVAKVLLCAPSNAAVDEVAKRLKEGIRNNEGKLYIPKVVRIGSETAVDAAVQDLFIDKLVENALSGTNSNDDSSTGAQANIQAMRSQIELLRSDRNQTRNELDQIRENSDRKSELQAQLKAIKSKINDLSQKMDIEADKEKQSRRAMDAQTRKVRLQILSEADVICSTLSGAGHDYMSQLPFDFETVIIDEAAQSIELSSLIPLKYGARRCIMVGDPLQLPPTVISKTAARAGYERSLFVRMMERGANSVHLLSIQYRMHSHISAFPSTAFYNSRLLDGPDMDAKTKQKWHDNPLFPPYAFMHVRGSREVQGRSHSWQNPTEASTALAIYERLLRDYSTIDFDQRIGVVTPYKGQVGELKRQFRTRYGDTILNQVSFNTVDGFQGQEKDIIILSCVRGGSAETGLGFLADTRRMNVALTRARSSLFILGDSQKLRANQYWSNLVSDAETRGLLTQVDPQTFRSTGPAPPPIVRATASASKSTAKAIAIPIPVYAPQEISARSKAQAKGSATVNPAPPSANSVKRRVTESMELPGAGPSSSSPAKKIKTENGAVERKSTQGEVRVKVESEEGEVVDRKPKIDSGTASPVPPPSRPPMHGAPPPPANRPPPPPKPAAPKAKPSIFLPKKRPPTGPTGGPQNKK